MILRAFKNNPPAFLKRGLGGVKKTSRVNLLRLALIFLLSLSLAACEKTIQWKQEVKLNDGRVILMERTSKRSGPVFPENNSGLELSQVITFTNPYSNEKITWPIPKGLKPYTLDFDNKMPYLVLNAYTVADYNRWNCPNPPFLVYRYENKKWLSIPFAQLPEKIIRRNLMDMSKSMRDITVNNYVTVAQQQKWINHGRAKWELEEFSTISRKKIHPIGHGCFESVLMKQGRESEINVEYYKGGVLVKPKTENQSQGQE